MDSNGRPGIDLHIHSTASDGSLSPAEILAKALAIGLKAIAITDHDTLAGAREASRLIEQYHPVAFLTGVEISAAPPPGSPFSGSIHILGYGIDLSNDPLEQTLSLLQDSRRNRNPRIIEKLRSLGLDISWEEVASLDVDGQLGRPHIAYLMVRKGLAQSIDDAFDRFLGKGKPGYVDKFRIPSQDAITIIRNAGGIPVLAHPVLLGDDLSAVEALVLRLREMGLRGIEAYYPESAPSQTERFVEMARRHELLMTGGTDFHGELRPDIQMGIGDGTFHVPFDLYEKLLLAM